MGHKSAENNKEFIVNHSSVCDMKIPPLGSSTMSYLERGGTSRWPPRQNQRKIHEEPEADPIGTEYVRADLLAAAVAARVRGLLRDYLDHRILFYRICDENQFRQINYETARLPERALVRSSGSRCGAAAPVSSLAVFRHERFLNSQGYIQAAWWNRVPGGAWGLMAAAICLPYWRATVAAALKPEQFISWFYLSYCPSRSLSSRTATASAEASFA
jgi:hypothetical protein